MFGLETIRRMNTPAPQGAPGYASGSRVRSGLRWKARKGLYSNSTGSCVYNPLTKEGFSYSWWQVTAVFDGLPVFNSYSYSVTTSGHQSKLYRIFSEDFPGHDIISVDFGPGLQKASRGLEDVRDFLYGEAKGLEEKQETGRKGSRAYEARACRLEQIGRHLALIDKVLTIKKTDPNLAKIVGGLI